MIDNQQRKQAVMKRTPLFEVRRTFSSATHFLEHVKRQVLLECKQKPESKSDQHLKGLGAVIVDLIVDVHLEAGDVQIAVGHLAFTVWLDARDIGPPDLVDILGG